MKLELLRRITINNEQCGGRPCIRVSSGAGFEEILEDYPYLEREDILASIEYAARHLDHAELLSA